ncbi:MAG: TetR/AcrR family transcriptional regulator [Actinomycetota bacterium]|nr:TetR/AcrR family transcriptional regulator [Actinomycetota bacterium]
MSMDADAQQLLAAAWRVLERSNFETCKVERVMKEAGVSARTFYRYFADKDELLLALMRDEMARSSRYLSAAVAMGNTSADKVRAWITAVIGAADDPRRSARARLFSSQQPMTRKYPMELAEGTAMLTAPLRTALEAGAATGEFPWVDTERDTELIYSLTGGEMTEALSQVPTPSVPERIEATVDFVLRSLGVPPAER